MYSTDYMHLIVISVLFLLLVGLLLSGSGERRFNNKYLFVFRILFPSWKFFDNSDGMYAVNYRVCAEAEDIEAADWVACPPKLQRAWYLLPLHPQGNIALACDSVAQHLSASINEAIEHDSLAEIHNSASYKTARNMTLYYIRKAAGESTFYQFKLTEKGSDGKSSDVMISPIYRYNDANEYAA